MERNILEIVGRYAGEIISRRELMCRAASLGVTAGALPGLATPCSAASAATGSPHVRRGGTVTYAFNWTVPPKDPHIANQPIHHFRKTVRRSRWKGAGRDRNLVA